MKTLKMTKILNAAGLLILTACNQTLPASSTEAVTAQPQAVSALSAPDSVPTVAAPVVNSISLTYYSVTSTRAPVNGFSNKTYVSTGHCVVYQSNTYCWDDGLKDLRFTYMHVAMGGWYSYFNFGPFGIGYDVAPGQITTDTMAAPTIITANLTAKFNSNSQSEVSQHPEYVFAHGVPTQVSCTEDSGILDCSDFSIDLNQAHL